MWTVMKKASLETFTCIMPVRHRFTSVNGLRYQLLKERCGDEPLNANNNTEMANMPTGKTILKDQIKQSNQST
jgi:hypothetical protein